MDHATDMRRRLALRELAEAAERLAGTRRPAQVRGPAPAELRAMADAMDALMRRVREADGTLSGWPETPPPAYAPTPVCQSAVERELREALQAISSRAAAFDASASGFEVEAFRVGVLALAGAGVRH